MGIGIIVREAVVQEDGDEVEVSSRQVAELAGVHRALLRVFYRVAGRRSTRARLSSIRPECVSPKWVSPFWFLWKLL